MAAGPIEDAGSELACPQCGTTVKQHSMIPILADTATDSADGAASASANFRYVCLPCARQLVVVSALPPPASP